MTRRMASSIHIYIYIYIYTKICARALGRAGRPRGLPARKHRTCRALATLAFENTAPAVLWPLWRSIVRGLLARKHRTCRALATWALENTAPAVLWPLGRSKTPHLPCFGHLGARKHRTCRALATWALDRAGPAGSKTSHLPCFGHVGARMGCSSPRSVPPERSKGLLNPPARCPQGARRGCSSPRSVPPGRSKRLLKPAQCPRMLQVAAQASAWYPMCAQSGISSPCSVLQGALELPPVSLRAREGVRECCSKSPKNTVYRALCHLPLLHPALPSGPQIVWPRIVRNASAHPC
jgi:hypothetical protein